MTYIRLYEWGELASHERLFNPPILALKARHSVFFYISKRNNFSPSFIWGVAGGCLVRDCSYIFMEDPAGFNETLWLNQDRGTFLL